MNPGLLRDFTGNDTEWMEYIDDQSAGRNIGDEVPQTLFFLKNSNGTILGAVSIRHFLNHTNIVDGGHIGYGICPEYRGNGYGSLILSLALKKLKEMGITKVLVTYKTYSQSDYGNFKIKCEQLLQDKGYYVHMVNTR
ncbi:MAG: GNAT family N-acetyltransferase [Paenibacillaceae bacterium]|nr:GNAT family N-acetyltransferase [Paenibacillaceae bacterium]